MSERIWACKIGGDIPDDVWRPDGEYMSHDYPMRVAAEQQFERQFGVEAKFLFSGWGAELTEPERAVVEGRFVVEGRLTEKLEPSSVRVRLFVNGTCLGSEVASLNEDGEVSVNLETVMTAKQHAPA